MYNKDMGKFIDRTGMRYGRLSVVEDAGVGAHKKRLWKCVCECGNETTLPSGSLASGNTQSCGCYHKDTITKHGGWTNSSYNTWRAMIRRCEKPKDKDYARYGARGISVCAEWKDYLRFMADMGEPKGSETLDRIDGNKGYYKENCRWASPHLQAVNTDLTSRTPHRGVVFVQKSNKWIANITVNRHRFYSKVYPSLEEALVARAELEDKYWGKTA